jgi:hypothetical protein
LVCKESDKQIAAFLNGSCEVKSLHEDRLILGFYYPFHKQKIEAPLNTKIIEDAASRLLGRRVALSCVITQRERDGQPRGGHLLRAAQQMGARPLDRKEGGESATGDEP